MTVPNFDYLSTAQSDATKTPIQTGVDFSYLDTPKEEPGLFSTAGNIVKNVHTILNAFVTANPELRTVPLLGAVAPTDLSESEMGSLGVKFAQAAQTGDPALKQAINDIRNIFGRFGEDPKGAINSAIEGAKKTGLAQIAAGLPKGAMDMMTSPLESVTGLGVDRPDLYAMTPEERAAKIKSTAGNIVGFAAGAGAGKLINAGFGQIAKAAVTTAAEETGTGALMNVTRSLRAGAFARKLVKGTIEGSAFGTAQSAVASANQPDQLTNMIVNGILFAPVGGALEMIHGGDPLVRNEDISVKGVDRGSIMKDVGPMGRAMDVLKLRQVEMTEHLSLNDVTKWTESFATAQDLDDAIVRGTFMTPKDVMVLDGMSQERVADLYTKLNPERTNYLKLQSEYETAYIDLDNARMDAIGIGKNTPEALDNIKQAQTKFNDVSTRFAQQKPPLTQYDVIDTEPFPREHATLLADLQQRRSKLQNDLADVRAKLDEKIEAKLPYSETEGLGRVVDNLELQIRVNQKNIDNLFIHQNMPQRTLLIGKDSGINADAKEFFSRSGYLPNEVVSYEGKDFLIKDHTDKPNAPIIAPHLYDPKTGQIIKVPDLKRIRIKSTGLTQSQYVEFTSTLNLKGRYLAEIKAAGGAQWGYRSSFEEQNQAAIAQAESGKPLTIIGFRQERGPNIGNAGRFYSAYSAGAAGYSPRKVSLSYFKQDHIVTTEDGLPSLESKTTAHKTERIDKDITTPAGKRQTLVIHKLEFENPLVVKYGDQSYLGGHYGLVKGAKKGFLPFDITDKEVNLINEAYKLTGKSTSGNIDPYVLVDKVIAKVLKDHGYDGIIYQDGSQAVDLRGNVALDQAKAYTVQGLVAGKASTETFRQKVFDDFKGEILDAAKEEHAKVPKDARELIGFDDKPPDNIADVTPVQSFNDLIDSYIKRKGIDPAQRDFLVSDFETRLHNELLQGNLDPVEKQAIAHTARAAEALRETEAAEKNQIRLHNIDRLARSAESNGYYIDHDGSQHFVLRDAQNDKILGRFNKMQDAQTFIDASGQMQGTELDGGGNNAVPPRMFGNAQPQSDGPLRPNELPFIASKDGWMGNITSSFNSILDWLTPNREILVAMDNKYGTKLFSEVYDKTQVARAKANAAIMPYYQKLQKIEAIDKRMTKGEREVVAGHLETMSADEIRQRGGGGGRALNVDEKRLAQDLVDSKGDINKAFKFNRQIDLTFDKIPESAGPERINAYSEIYNALGMTKDDEAAANILKAMRNQKVASIGPTVRLAQTLAKGGGITQPEYAAFHKMTPQQLAMSNQLSELFKELAPKFGIDDKHLLQNYMTHARLYAKGDISGALNQFDIKGANKEFYAKMVRTGEVDAYETDPIRAAQRYIKAGFDAQMMDAPMAEARKSLNTELLKVPDEAQEKIKRVADRYLNDLQGSPGAASKFTQATVDKMMDGLGVPVSIDVRKNIVNVISATGEAAAQGFRLVAGIRDFYTGVSLYYARFGVARTARMLKMGLTGLEELSRQSLSEAGVIPTLSQVAFDTPTDFTSTVLGRSTGMIGDALRTVGEVGLKLSGQKDVYAMLHAGAYLDTWSLVGENLRKYNRNEITLAKAYKNIELQSYHAPVAQAFDQLVKAQKFDEAAQMLGRATGAEQVGIFGLGNNPGGWNRNIGRLAGQFGSWSMWYRAHMMQMVSRGSYGYRAASVARLAATQAVLVGISAATGVRLGSWYVPPGITFAGGPLVGAMQTVNDAVSGYGPEQTLAQGRLRRFLPYDPNTGKYHVAQIYIPGSFFVNDLARAYQGIQVGQSVPAVAAQAIGFRFPQQQ